jgi:hypothetical protein
MPSRNGTDLVRKITVAVKYYSEWKRSLKPGANALSDGVPWVTCEARDFIAAILTPSAVVFEYGAGGSTVFYSKRVKKVISVEHDTTWANLVASALVQNGIKTCESRLIPPTDVDTLDGNPDDPEVYCSTAEEYKGHTFRDYVLSIDSFPDEFFDYVAVDGRARPSCIRHARSKIKIGGYLMLDNSERAEYDKGKNLMLGWEKFEFFGPGPYGPYFWETTVWKKTHAQS